MTRVIIYTAQQAADATAASTTDGDPSSAIMPRLVDLGPLAGSYVTGAAVKAAFPAIAWLQALPEADIDPATAWAAAPP